MTKRAEKAKQTRERIIHVAMDLFRQKSFKDVSVEDITKQSGVAKGTFYTYFPTKESIIFALDELFESLPSLSEESLPFMQRVSNYLEEYIHRLNDEGVEILRLWFRYATDSHNDQVNNKWALDIKLLTQLFNDAIKKGELAPNTPVDDLVALLNAQLYGFITAWCMVNTGVEPIDWVPKMVSYFETAITPYLTEK